MGLFDWLAKSREQPDPPGSWHVHREGTDIVAEGGRGVSIRVPLSGARAVRIVPLTGGDQHRGSRGGWQVALGHKEGDVLVGKPFDDWRAARQLAQQVCETSGLSFDELTEKMFSRVGQ